MNHDPKSLGLLLQSHLHFIRVSSPCPVLFECIHLCVELPSMSRWYPSNMEGRHEAEHTKFNLNVSWG